MSLISVVLPLPEAPTIAVILPLGISKDTLSIVFFAAHISYLNSIPLTIVR